MPLAAIVAIYAAGLALIVCETFVPGAVIGTLGILLITGSIYLSFDGGYNVLGFILIGTSLIAVPLIIIKGLSRISLKSRQTKEEGYTSTETGIENLAGQQGVSLSPLRPAGIARFGDRKLSVVTRGEMIYPHTKIEVVEVKGNRVVVKAVRT